MAGSNRGNLVVGLNGRRVALLRRVPNGARLTYEPDVVTHLGGAPLLSTALPVRAQEFDAGLPKASGRNARRSRPITRSWSQKVLPGGCVPFPRTPMTMSAV